MFFLGCPLVSRGCARGTCTWYGRARMTSARASDPRKSLFKRARVDCQHGLGAREVEAVGTLVHDHG
jgi:hypothetical protein